MSDVQQHLRNLIADADPEGVYMQPTHAVVVAAEEDFENAGFDVSSLPWGAIATRAYELERFEED
jgi:hypothetical protein